MATKTTQNKTARSNGNRKLLVAAVSVVSALAVILVVFLAAKNPIYFYDAQKHTLDGEYSEAIESVRKSSGAKAEMLEKYIMLRLDINSCYPDLLTEYDSEKLIQWKSTAEFINGHSALLGEELALQAQELNVTLGVIVDGVGCYEDLRGDVLSMMDVFAEINRLHTKGPDGKNIGFTVEEERRKIQKWEQQCDALEEYSMSLPGYEKIYLLNYLIKEVQGECSDLSEAMDSVIESGYSETDNVRFSGEGRKTYPDMQSNNASVNLLEKENYEHYVYKGICRALVESLGEFYNP